MADEKKFSAKDAAIAVLKKAEEMLKSSTLSKSGFRDEDVKGVHGTHRWQSKGAIKDVNQPGMSRAGAQARIGAEGYPAAAKEAKDHHKKVLSEMKAMPKPKLGKSEVEKQVAPEDNAKEIKEGNNAAPGAFPQNEKKYGAEKLKKGMDGATGAAISAGFNAATAAPAPAAPIHKEEGAEAPMKGHIKLAKFMGRMEHKRMRPNSNQATGHEKGIHPQVGQIGQSSAGNDAGDQSSPFLQERAKTKHRQVLGEMKDMSGKDRSGMGKTEELAKAKVDEGKSLAEKKARRSEADPISEHKGVHVQKFGGKPGVSKMGAHAREGNAKTANYGIASEGSMDEAKSQAKRTLLQAKKLTPKLPG